MSTFAEFCLVSYAILATVWTTLLWRGIARQEAEVARLHGMLNRKNTLLRDVRDSTGREAYKA
jgi:hypothetical protein